MSVDEKYEDHLRSENEKLKQENKQLKEKLKEYSDWFAVTPQSILTVKTIFDMNQQYSNHIMDLIKDNQNLKQKLEIMMAVDEDLINCPSCNCTIKFQTWVEEDGNTVFQIIKENP